MASEILCLFYAGSPWGSWDVETFGSTSASKTFHWPIVILELVTEGICMNKWENPSHQIDPPSSTDVSSKIISPGPIYSFCLAWWSSHHHFWSQLLNSLLTDLQTLPLIPLQCPNSRQTDPFKTQIICCSSISKLFQVFHIVLRIESKHLTTLTLTDYPPELHWPRFCSSNIQPFPTLLCEALALTAVYMIHCYFQGSAKIIYRYSLTAVLKVISLGYIHLCLLP